MPLTCRRFWEALWFCHVRTLSDTPLAFRLSLRVRAEAPGAAGAAPTDGVVLEKVT